MDEQFLRQAEMHLRLHIYALVPLHEGLIDAMCASAAPPLELATMLEDIGQHYIRMAEALNGAIIERDMIDNEPEEFKDYAEACINRFAAELLSQAGVVSFSDGTRIDGRAALEAFPFVGDAIRSAVLLARDRKLPRLRRIK